MKHFLAVFAALLLTLSLAACGTPAATSSSLPAPQGSGSAASAPAPQGPDSGVTPPPPQRIISLAPSNTEILTALGCAGNLVAVDSYSVDLTDVPDGIPAFDMMQPDAEQMIALTPDLVLTTGMSAADGIDPFKGLRDAGVHVVDIATAATIAEIEQSITTIGDAVGKAAEATALNKTFADQLAGFEAVAKTIPTKTKVYFEIAPAPAPYSFGSDVFLDEMLALCGAENILANESGWLAVSEEQVIAKNPDVIFTNVNYTENPVEELKARNGWGSITAIKTGAVYQISNNPTALPNHNIVLALREMTAILYPDLYKGL